MPRGVNGSPKEEGFSHILVLLAVLVITGLVAYPQIKTTKVLSATQNVLGEEESKINEQAQESAQKAAEQQKEAQQKIQEQQKESAQVQVEGKKQETEVTTATGVKIKTKVEDDGSSKIEMENGKSKFKYQTGNKKVELEVEDEASKGGKEDLKDTEDEIEQELEKEGIEIGTESGKRVITKNKVSAIANFPISVSTATGQLIITTPAGVKVVTILPDQAVANLLSHNIVNRIENQASSSAGVELEERNNEMVYKIKGVKNHHLFGLIPISTDIIAFVSAQSGNVVAQDQSLLTSLINLLSSN